jgi:hypothetical protein
LKNCDGRSVSNDCAAATGDAHDRIVPRIIGALGIRIGKLLGQKDFVGNVRVRASILDAKPADGNAGTTRQKSADGGEPIQRLANS